MVLAPQEAPAGFYPQVTVIVPAYNAAGTLSSCLAALASQVYPCSSYEVIVVDDGSTDDTAARAAAAGARVVRLAPNGGKGVALRHALPLTRGDVIVILDADGQDHPADIPLLLEALRPGVDMVVGSRFLGRFGPGAITPVNRLGNQFLTAVVNLLFGCHLTDTQAGFRAMRRHTVLGWKLAASRYDIEVDLLLSVLRSGGRIVEVPVRREARSHGRSGLDSVRDGTRILLRIVRKRFGPPT